MMNSTTVSREGWVDAAKGIAIILVVLFHSSMFLELVDLAGPWPRVVALLDTFRMPLFFFTAGLFAARVVAGAFVDVWRKRVANLLWVYALWTLIWLLLFRPLLGESAAAEVGELNPLVEWVISLVLPNESTWFLWALAVYFLLAWCLKRVPIALQIALAAAVSILSTVPDISSPPLEKALANFVFFLLAVHFGTLLRRAFAGASWKLHAALSALYIVVLLPLAKFDLLSVPGMKLVLGTLGIGFGVSAAVMLTRWRAGGGLEALGRRTLPIYLVHFYVAAAAAALAWRLGNIPNAMVPVMVPAVACLAIAVSLGLYRITRRIPGLWGIPRRWITGRMQRS